MAIAVSWAEVIGATKILIIAVEEDSSDYPDTRQEFYDAFNKVIELCTKTETKIAIETPIINLKKADIIRKGFNLGAPLHLSSIVFLTCRLQEISFKSIRNKQL